MLPGKMDLSSLWHALPFPRLHLTCAWSESWLSPPPHVPLHHHARQLRNQLMIDDWQDCSNSSTCVKLSWVELIWVNFVVCLPTPRSRFQLKLLLRLPPIHSPSGTFISWMMQMQMGWCGGGGALVLDSFCWQQVVGPACADSVSPVPQPPHES